MNDHLDEQNEGDVSLLAVASQIDEGRPIDWDTQEEAARDDRERAVLAELRLLASMTRVCRDPDESVENTVQMAAAHAPPQVWTWASLTILEAVGRGGFAQVHRARDPLGRDVAVKLFPIRSDGASAVTRRVMREGSLLAKVRHPNVVVVHGVESADGHIGLCMEFIVGRTMEQELRTRGPFSADEASLIGADLCKALAAVHSAGLLHRDVKAQNVMREEGGRTVLMDFGAGSEEIVDRSGRIDVAGTPLYLAPELFERRRASRASDIYSLGVLLFRMVSGKYPVEGKDRAEIAEAHRQGRRLRLRDVRPDLPAPFVQAIEKALSPDPKDRFETAAAFEAALTARNSLVTPTTLTWKQWTGAIAAALALLAIPAWLLTRQGPTIPSSNPSPSTAAAVPAAADAYNVSARFYRREPSGRAIPLVSRDTVAPGQVLALEFEASVPVFLYVITVDERGEQFLLVSPGAEGKPLEAGRIHWLPAPIDQPNNSWQITTAGGREHFLVMASPDRLKAFEGLLKDLPAPKVGAVVKPARVSEAVTSELTGELRGVGGLVTAPPSKPGTASRWFEGVRHLAGERETASGIWARQVIFENPER